MNHYDDLQRFCDKLPDHHASFKELSARGTTNEFGDWYLLKGITEPDREPTEFRVVPRPVSATEFQLPEGFRPAHETSEFATSVAQLTDPQAMAEAVIEPVAVIEAMFGQQRLATQGPTGSNTPVNDGPIDYARLFATPASQVSAPQDDPHLHSLLERIGSCR
ncbi:hypothetical protein GJV06_11495 [Enterobacteriaceae bacterium RIT691]|nr:hypothetical protein [Enterobacteriaceae bacterium RIT691]